jgi:hypothetical protein
MDDEEESFEEVAMKLLGGDLEELFGKKQAQEPEPHLRALLSEPQGPINVENVGRTTTQKRKKPRTKLKKLRLRMILQVLHVSPLQPFLNSCSIFS